MTTTNNNHISVLIAEDQVATFLGLHMLIEGWNFDVITPGVTSGRDLLQRIRETRPNVLLLDVKMPGLLLLDALRAIKSEGLTVKVMLLTAGVDPITLREAHALGINGCMLKDDAVYEKIGYAIKAVAAGGSYWSEEALKLLHGTKDQEHSPVSFLTENQILVAVQFIRGINPGDIGESLGWSRAQGYYLLDSLRTDLAVSEDGRGYYGLQRTLLMRQTEIMLRYATLPPSLRDRARPRPAR